MSFILAAIKISAPETSYPVNKSSVEPTTGQPFFSNSSLKTSTNSSLERFTLPPDFHLILFWGSL